jgi:ubiquitin C-terminal hydrolase
LLSDTEIPSSKPIGRWVLAGDHLRYVLYRTNTNDAEKFNGLELPQPQSHPLLQKLQTPPQNTAKAPGTGTASSTNPTTSAPQTTVTEEFLPFFYHMELGLPEVFTALMCIDCARCSCQHPYNEPCTHLSYKSNQNVCVQRHQQWQAQGGLPAHVPNALTGDLPRILVRTDRDVKETEKGGKSEGKHEKNEKNDDSKDKKDKNDVVDPDWVDVNNGESGGDGGNGGDEEGGGIVIVSVSDEGSGDDCNDEDDDCNDDDDDEDDDDDIPNPDEVINALKETKKDSKNDKTNPEKTNSSGEKDAKNGGTNGDRNPPQNQQHSQPNVNHFLNSPAYKTQFGHLPPLVMAPPLTVDTPNPYKHRRSLSQPHYSYSSAQRGEKVIIDLDDENEHSQHSQHSQNSITKPLSNSTTTTRPTTVESTSHHNALNNARLDGFRGYLYKVYPQLVSAGQLEWQYQTHSTLQFNMANKSNHYANLGLKLPTLQLFGGKFKEFLNLYEKRNIFLKALLCFGPNLPQNDLLTSTSSQPIDNSVNIQNSSNTSLGMAGLAVSEGIGAEEGCGKNNEQNNEKKQSQPIVASLSQPNLFSQGISQDTSNTPFPSLISQIQGVEVDVSLNPSRGALQRPHHRRSHSGQAWLLSYQFPSNNKEFNVGYFDDHGSKSSNNSNNNNNNNNGKNTQVNSNTQQRELCEILPLTSMITGLRNIGNTCYLNSILQPLLHILPFSHYIMRHPEFYISPAYTVSQPDYNTLMSRWDLRDYENRRMILSVCLNNLFQGMVNYSGVHAQFGQNSIKNNNNYLFPLLLNIYQALHTRYMKSTQAQPIIYTYPQPPAIYEPIGQQRRKLLAKKDAKDAKNAKNAKKTQTVVQTKPKSQNDSETNNIPQKDSKNTPSNPETPTTATIDTQLDNIGDLNPKPTLLSQYDDLEKTKLVSSVRPVPFFLPLSNTSLSHLSKSIMDPSIVHTMPDINAHLKETGGLGGHGGKMGAELNGGSIEHVCIHGFEHFITPEQLQDLLYYQNITFRSTRLENIEKLTQDVESRKAENGGGKKEKETKKDSKKDKTKDDLDESRFHRTFNLYPRYLTCYFCDGHQNTSLQPKIGPQKNPQISPQTSQAPRKPPSNTTPETLPDIGGSLFSKTRLNNQNLSSNHSFHYLSRYSPLHLRKHAVHYNSHLFLNHSSYVPTDLKTNIIHYIALKKNLQATRDLIMDDDISYGLSQSGMQDSSEMLMWLLDKVHMEQAGFNAETKNKFFLSHLSDKYLVNILGGNFVGLEPYGNNSVGVSTSLLVMNYLIEQSVSGNGGSQNVSTGISRANSSRNQIEPNNSSQTNQLNNNFQQNNQHNNNSISNLTLLPLFELKDENIIKQTVSDIITTLYESMCQVMVKNLQNTHLSPFLISLSNVLPSITHPIISELINRNSTIGQGLFVPKPLTHPTQIDIVFKMLIFLNLFNFPTYPQSSYTPHLDQITTDTISTVYKYPFSSHYPVGELAQFFFNMFISPQFFAIKSPSTMFLSTPPTSPVVGISSEHGFGTPKANIVQDLTLPNSPVLNPATDIVLDVVNPNHPINTTSVGLKSTPDDGKNGRNKQSAEIEVLKKMTPLVVFQQLFTNITSHFDFISLWFAMIYTITTKGLNDGVVNGHFFKTFIQPKIQNIITKWEKKNKKENEKFLKQIKNEIFFEVNSAFSALLFSQLENVLFDSIIYYNHMNTASTLSQNQIQNSSASGGPFGGLFKSKNNKIEIKPDEKEKIYEKFDKNFEKSRSEKHSTTSFIHSMASPINISLDSSVNSLLSPQAIRHSNPSSTKNSPRNSTQKIDKSEKSEKVEKSEKNPQKTPPPTSPSSTPAPKSTLEKLLFAPLPLHIIAQGAFAWHQWLRTNTSRVTDVFAGQTCSSTICAHCLNISYTFESFTSLSLSIPKFTTKQLEEREIKDKVMREKEDMKAGVFVTKHNDIFVNFESNKGGIYQSDISEKMLKNKNEKILSQIKNEKDLKKQLKLFEKENKNNSNSNLCNTNSDSSGSRPNTSNQSNSGDVCDVTQQIYDTNSKVYKDNITLFDCLSDYFKYDPIDIETQWKCSYCKVPRSGARYTQLMFTPEVLILTFKRFNYDGQKLFTNVNYPLDNVKFPTIIDTYTDFKGIGNGGDYYDEYFGNKNDKSSKNASKNTLSNSNSTFTLPSEPLTVPIQFQDNYNLIGQVLHSGSVGAGHYISQCLTPSGWVTFNDTCCRSTSSTAIQSPSAYILFYSRSKGQNDGVRGGVGNGGMRQCFQHLCYLPQQGGFDTSWTQDVFNYSPLYHGYSFMKNIHSFISERVKNQQNNGNNGNNVWETGGNNNKSQNDSNQFQLINPNIDISPVATQPAMFWPCHCQHAVVQQSQGLPWLYPHTNIAVKLLWDRIYNSDQTE